MQPIKKILATWHHFYKKRLHQQFLLFGILLFIATCLFFLNVQIGNSTIGNQQASARVPGINCYNAGGNCQDTCPSALRIGESCDGEGTYCCNYSICENANAGPGTYCGGANGAKGNTNTVYTCSGTCTKGSGNCIVTDMQVCGSNQHCQVSSSDRCVDNGGGQGNPPTATPTQGSNNGDSPTATPTPKGPTATPIPTGPSKVKIIISLPAIGGRNGGNPVPHRSTRTITLYFYKPDQDPSDPGADPVAVKTGKVSLDTTVGSLTYGSFVNFPATGIDLGKLYGTYKVLVKSNSYLRVQFIPKDGDSSSTFTFTGGQITSLPKVSLLPGDIYPPASAAGQDAGDNTLDISDYNLLIRQCYNNKSSCPDKAAADLNDDGNVDGIDYNILIRSFKQLSDNGSSNGGDGQ